jgi:hypothetical protein
MAPMTAAVAATAVTAATGWWSQSS